jgi:hypothetical protein
LVTAYDSIQTVGRMTKRRKNVMIRNFQVERKPFPLMNSRKAPPLPPARVDPSEWTWLAWIYT